MPILNDQAIRLQLENSASDLTPAVAGLVYFNTGTTFAKYYNATSWKTLSDTDSVQTFSNKVHDNTNTYNVKDTLFTLQDDGDATKLAVFQLSGITTGTTRTFTFPDASLTFLGRADTATVQNKTVDNTNTLNIKDTLFTLQDDGDATKLFQLQLSSITTGTTRTWTVPDMNGTFLGTTTTQSISGKTFLDALLVAEISTPSTPASGFGKIYPKSDNKLYYLDDSGVETQVGASGSGSGEINTITNPSAATDTTGWTAGTSHTVTRDTSNSPLSPITSTCFDIAATTTAAESFTSGVYWSTATHPTGLRNRKLKVEFYYTTSASQTWALGVYAGSTRMNLSTDSSGATTLPAGVTGGKFTAYFDADSSTAYTIHFTRTVGAGTTHLYITNVINGPGTQPQGAVVGPWTAFTPVINNTGSKSFTTALGYWRRIGDTMEINVQLDSNATASGSAATTAVTVSMPTGYTIVTAQALNASGFGFEQGIQSAGNFSNLMDIAVASSSTIEMILQGTSRAVSIGDLNAARVMSIDMHAFLPINEWAGSGTVNVAQNDVEYASNSAGTTDASDTTSFAYGPSGSQGPSGALTADRAKRARFQTPIQPSDSIWLEVSEDRIQWRRIGNVTDGNASMGLIISWLGGNSTNYGMGWRAVAGSSTDIDIAFARYTRPAGTWDAAGAAWTGTWYYRAVKAKAGQAVGFGEVVPGLSSGLVSSAGLKGKTAGGSVATGYVGETVSQAITTIKTTVSADTFVDSSQTLTLDPGKWRIEYRGWMGLDWVSGTPRVQGALAIRTGSTTVETQAWRVTLTTSFPGLYMPAQLTAEVDISAQTVYKMSVVCEQASGTATATLGNNASAFSGTNVVANSKMVATRIA
jgi:hypothetical protein